MDPQRLKLTKGHLGQWPVWQGRLASAHLWVTPLFSDNPKRQEAEFLSYLKTIKRNPLLLKQIHSGHVMETTSKLTHPEADAWVTRDQGWVAVRTADCAPVALVDPNAQVRGLVHSGWRGTDAEILPNTLRKMDQLGAKKSDIYAFLGPFMRSCCYQVGEEVGMVFAERYPGSFHPDGKGRGMLDLGMILKKQLSVGGVTRVEDSAWCTGCGNEPFHSYRREGSEGGRTLTILGPFGQGEAP